MQYLSPKDLVVSSPDGCHAIALYAGVPKEIPDEWVKAVVLAGALPHVPGDETPAPHTSAPEPAQSMAPLEAVVEAMRQLLESGDPEKLTAGGIPRTKEIEALVGG